jgi:hypothetical protein
MHDSAASVLWVTGSLHVNDVLRHSHSWLRTNGARWQALKRLASTNHRSDVLTSRTSPVKLMSFVFEPFALLGSGSACTSPRVISLSLDNLLHAYSKLISGSTRPVVLRWMELDGLRIISRKCMHAASEHNHWWCTCMSRSRCKRFHRHDLFSQQQYVALVCGWLNAVRLPAWHCISINTRLFFSSTTLLFHSLGD